MAEAIITNENSRRNLKVDLTPMVDLGFILISFFLFTRTITEPKAMRLVMPDKAKIDSSEAPASATLTLYPGAKSVHYEEGRPGEHPLREAFLDRSPSVREEIVSLQNRLVQSTRFSKKDMTVIIKPDRELNYGQLIGVLDEMTICGVERYMIVEMGR